MDGFQLACEAEQNAANHLNRFYKENIINFCKLFFKKHTTLKEDWKSAVGKGECNFERGGG